MSHFIHAPGPVACRRPPSEPVIVVPGARVCPRVPRLPVTSVDGRPPDRTGNVALADVARLVPGAVPGNLASLAEGGNPADSGISSAEVRQAVAEAGTAYQKPEGGVPKADLSEGVRASLGLADAAVQPGDILSGGKIKSDLLPSYVDDVIEAANYASLPSPGEEGKIYVTLDTNKTYRWGGTAYVEISNPDLTEYAKRAELFPAWAANTAYTTYSLVIHENAIYKCTTAHTSGAEWDSTKWAVASGAKVLAMLRHYPALSNKPSVNSVTLSGNKTAADLGLASTADATLTERGFSAWVLADDVNNPITGEWLEEWQRFSPSATSGEVTIVNNKINIGGVPATADQDASQDGLSLVFNGFGWANLGNALGISVGDTVATRTALPGYVLGSQSDKPLASEAEAEALRNDKLDKSAVVSPSSSATAGQAADAKATGDALAGKANKADATLTERGPNHDGFSEWTLTPNPGDDVFVLSTGDMWRLVKLDTSTGEYSSFGMPKGERNSLTISWTEGVDALATVTATRTVLQGYQLGSQTTKPLASEAEAEALRNTTVKQVQLSTASQGTSPISPVDGLVTLPVSNSANSPSGTTLASSKAVKTVNDAKLGKTDVVAPSTSSADSGKAADAKATGDAIAAVAPDWVSGSSYAQYDVVKYNGMYYSAKSATSGTTAPSSDTTHWGSLANLAALAHLFLPLTGGTVTGTLTLAEVDGGGTEIVKAFLGSTSSQKFVIGVSGGNFYIGQYGHNLWLPYTSGTLALLQQIGIHAFDSTATYAVGAKVVYGNAVWNCTTEVSTAGSWTGTTNWTKLFDLAVDSTPTANSDSLMTSGAIKTALDAKANASDLPYALGTPIVISTASSETVEGETVNYGAATLADRTANIVQVTAATALDELRITFPAATSGKVRDFGLRVEIGTGSAALAAPALVPIAPTGETIKIENNASEIPALADGTATAKGVTLLYFSENAPGVFVVKGEQVEEVA